MEGALGDFELVINYYKTEIKELPQPFSRTWPSELINIEFRADSEHRIQTDTFALFNKAAEIAAVHPGALKYALRMCVGRAVPRSMWRAFQGLVWSAVSAEPTTMPVAIDLLLLKAQETGEEVNLLAACDVLESQILTHAPLRNGSEVSWALWAACRLRLTLSQAVAREVSSMEDDFVAILALHADATKRFVAGQLDVTAWDSLLDHPGALRGPHWLLAYESVRHGWSRNGMKLIKQDAFFGPLLKAGVRFFDPERIAPPFTGAAGPMPGSLMPDDYL